MSATVCGECFDWAYRNLPDARFSTLVHARVHDPWDRERSYSHAWIERAGRAFDWQSAQGLGPGRRGWVLKKFYDVYQPDHVIRYSYDESRVQAVRHGHFGPWA